MKKAMLVLLFSFSAMAANDVANSNNTIIVKPQITVKTGCCLDSCKKQKEQTIIKTVIQKVEVEKQIVVPVEVQKIVYVEVKKEQNKNRVSVLIGAGPTHIDNNTAGQVDLYRGPVGALQYQRSLSESWNLGIQGQTNQTVLGSIGFDF